MISIKIESDQSSLRHEYNRKMYAERLTRFSLPFGIQLAGQLVDPSQECLICLALPAKFIFVVLGLMDPGQGCLDNFIFSL
jgi:hypothetical protein